MVALVRDSESFDAVASKAAETAAASPKSAASAGDGAVDIGNAEDISTKQLRPRSHTDSVNSMTVLPGENRQGDIKKKKKSKATESSAAAVAAAEATEATATAAPAAEGLMRWFSLGRSRRTLPSQQNSGKKLDSDIEQQHQQQRASHSASGTEASYEADAVRVPLGDADNAVQQATAASAAAGPAAPQHICSSSVRLSDKNIVTQTSVLSRMGQHRLIRIDVAAASSDEDEDDNELPLGLDADIESRLSSRSAGSAGSASPAASRTRISYHGSQSSQHLQLLQPVEQSGVVCDCVEEEFAEQAARADASSEATAETSWGTLHHVAEQLRGDLEEGSASA